MPSGSRKAIISWISSSCVRMPGARVEDHAAAVRGQQRLTLRAAHGRPRHVPEEDLRALREQAARQPAAVPTEASTASPPAL